MPKGVFFRKKSFIVIGVISGVFLSLYLILSIRLGNTICYERDYNLGWDCWYSWFFPFVPPIKNIEYKRKCEKAGGEYRSMVVTRKMANSGPVTLNNTGPYFYCVIPFSDYGKDCKNGGDCQGFCCEFVGDIPEFCKNEDGNNSYIDHGIYECSQDIVGKCSKGLCRSGGGRRRVEDNKIIKDALFLY